MRESFKSKSGLLLSAAGSAIGLGNIWRFSYVVGNNGGGAFISVYLILLSLVGISAILCELAIGAYGRCNPIDAYAKINKKFKIAGSMGTLCALLFMCYYPILGAITIFFSQNAVMGSFVGNDIISINYMLNAFLESPSLPAIYIAIYIAAVGAVVYMGVQKGMERASKLLMPMLFAMLIFMAGRSLIFAQGAWDCMRWLFIPDFSQVNLKMIFDAIGQMFFSLSVGSCTLVILGSYSPKEGVNFPKLAVNIALLDTISALIAAIAIFPMLQSNGLNAGQGIGTAFCSMAFSLGSIPFSILISTVFFVLLFVAALTSTTSSLELLISVVCERTDLERKKAVVMVSVACLCFSVVVVWGFGQLGFIKVMGMNLFELLDSTVSNILMPITAMLSASLVGYFWNSKEIRQIIPKCDMSDGLMSLWLISARYFVPIIAVIVLITPFIM